MKILGSSRNFLEIIDMYKQMHDEGYNKIDGEFFNKDNGKIKHIPLEYGCKIKDYL